MSNDAGFRLVKESFDTSVPETFKTWTVMETPVSLVALVFILLPGMVAWRPLDADRVTTRAAPCSARLRL